MQHATLAIYATAALIGGLIPGPNTLLALANGVSGNWRVVFVGMCGAALSDVIVVAAVGAGLGALLMASASLFATIKWIGVAYLVWLAIQLWRAQPQDLSRVRVKSDLSARRVFLRSFGVALTNPKILLFFSAFLPQFVDTSMPLAPQYAVLAVVSAAIDIVVMTLYATGGVQAARLMTARGLKRLNRVCAVVMFSLAGGLALYRKSGS
ncbi:lysine transporter LysE [Pandoraea vervacti]|uniref:Lysine transporter LysE n=1 Tax=Pandoraea vervacti TaxID=656178 RepID=A0ABM5T1E7_9BURK|nr:LysE family translocator [Pandoraea vervacti]AJP58697.1 lysine transporter LysE [Pandoraea vervacti]